MYGMMCEVRQNGCLNFSCSEESGASNDGRSYELMRSCPFTENVSSALTITGLYTTIDHRLSQHAFGCPRKLYWWPFNRTIVEFDVCDVAGFDDHGVRRCWKGQ